jgi:hypothetical protein
MIGTRCSESFKQPWGVAPTSMHLYPGPVAQLVEHRTFNPQVPGSSPGRPTIEMFNKINGLEN